MSDLDRLLQTVIERNASDLHLNDNSRISYRIDGKIYQDGPRILGEQIFQLCLVALSSEQQRKYFEEKSIDFSHTVNYNGEKVRFRGSLIYQKGKSSCVFRKINSEILPIEVLGLPNVIKEKALLDWGMILVTGATGSGKSTTLASIIDYINKEKYCHIATIEEPLEYIHTNKNSIVTQREVGKDSSSFAESMKTVLRQDPDVILVGEMRDYETVSAAVTNAETGHLVLATLHTNTAPDSIRRIVDMYPPAQHNNVLSQLANNLKLVINQRLYPKKGGGRFAAYEIMVIDEEIKELIRMNNIEDIYKVMENNKHKGNLFMEDCIDIAKQKGWY